MNRNSNSLAAVIIATLTIAAGAASAQDGRAPQVLPAGIRGGSETVPEPRVELRKYLFEPTKEELPYAVFVSSKVKPGQKAPLIVALRGFTGTPLTMVRGSAIDLAEQGGYILVGPIGYNNRSGFGVPPRTGAAPAAGSSLIPRQLPPIVGGTAETDSANASQYSEQDVMNVLALVRKEFVIDDQRIYLMGHSQGGGGARHLANKYPDIWAAVALLAPAIFDDATAKSARVPLLIEIGDKDPLLDGVRRFHSQLETLKVSHQYLERPGLDHSTIIMGAMPDAFQFFAQLSKTK